MGCRGCGAAASPGAVFCLRCGIPLQTSAAPIGLPCASCHAVNPPDSRFCRECGSSLAAASPGQSPAAQASVAPAPCPRCGALTPAAFAFCQQCGFKVAPRAASVSAPPNATNKMWGRVIVVHRDGRDGELFPLKNDVVVVGRERADLVFADDRFLAPQHARLERRADGVYLIAIDAINGVYRRLHAPVRLASGASFLLGREVLRYEAIDADALQSPQMQHNVVVFGSPPRPVWGRLQQVTMAGPVGDVRYLAGNEVVIGREDGAIVYPDDPFLSRRHAVLRPVDRGCELTDLESSNGSYVRLLEPWLLSRTTHIRLGDQLLRIELTP